MKVLSKVLMVLMFVTISATAEIKGLDPMKLREVYTPSCHFETLGGERPKNGVEKEEAVVYAIVMAPIDAVAALFNLIPTK